MFSRKETLSISFIYQAPCPNLKYINIYTQQGFIGLGMITNKGIVGARQCGPFWYEPSTRFHQQDDVNYTGSLQVWHSLASVTLEGPCFSHNDPILSHCVKGGVAASLPGHVARCCSGYSRKSRVGSMNRPFSKKQPWMHEHEHTRAYASKKGYCSMLFKYIYVM